MSTTALLLTLAIGFTDAPTENPYAKARVGDSVTYKTSMPNLPPGMQASMMTKTVAAKSDDSVTLKIQNKMGDMEMPAQEMKFNLKEKPESPKGVKTEVKKLGEGKEKITIGGKTYDCTWSAIEVTTTAEADGTKHTFKTKTWMCKDVPLDGMVKMENEVSGQKSTTELVSVTKGK